MDNKWLTDKRIREGRECIREGVLIGDMRDVLDKYSYAIDVNGGKGAREANDLYCSAVHRFRLETDRDVPNSIREIHAYEALKARVLGVAVL